MNEKMNHVKDLVHQHHGSSNDVAKMLDIADAIVMTLDALLAEYDVKYDAGQIIINVDAAISYNARHFTLDVVDKRVTVEDPAL